ncbi:unnamed protein product [Phytophthora fragariaefolia]|uniref:Unnamed protein product n=1 Tax=Phytophthora fragariaefolia TaxID=1490495 RepID=A0A9W6XL07_9STRA|nr:unnamed protein product [Phytophthora fragariaefolia]
MWITNFGLVAGVAENRYPRSDRHLAAYLRAHSVADSTFDQYNRALNKWVTWSARHGVPPSLEGMPLADQVQHISDFNLHGFQYGFGSGGGIRSDSIMAVPTGVRHFFAAAGRDFPLAHLHIRMLFKGISRLDSPPRWKAPVSIELLEACFHSLSMVEPFEQALWGVMCLAFFFPYEAIGNCSDHWWFVQVVCYSSTRHYSIGYSRKANLVFLESTFGVCAFDWVQDKPSRFFHKENALTVRAPVPMPRGWCPDSSSNLEIYACEHTSRSVPGPPRKAGVCYHGGCNRSYQVSRCQHRPRPATFQFALSTAGGATRMYRAGTDALTIQFHGRWVSDAFKSYTRLCKESVAMLAENMVVDPRGDTTLH